MSTTAFMLIRFHQPCCQDADLGAEVVVFLAEVKRENDSSVRVCEKGERVALERRSGLA